jgi:hypothetical protein
MRVTHIATDPGFITLCIELAQAAFAPAMPTADPQRSRDPAKASASPERRRPGLISAIADWFHRQEVKEREAYLAQSADIFDLERRIRFLERRPYY